MSKREEYFEKILPLINEIDAEKKKELKDWLITTLKAKEYNKIDDFLKYVIHLETSLVIELTKKYS